MAKVTAQNASTFFGKSYKSGVVEAHIGSGVSFYKEWSEIGKPKPDKTELTNGTRLSQIWIYSNNDIGGTGAISNGAGYDVYARAYVNGAMGYLMFYTTHQGSVDVFLNDLEPDDDGVSDFTEGLAVSGLQLFKNFDNNNKQPTDLIYTLPDNAYVTNIKIVGIVREFGSTQDVNYTICSCKYVSDSGETYEGYCRFSESSVMTGFRHQYIQPSSGPMGTSSSAYADPYRSDEGVNSSLTSDSLSDYDGSWYKEAEDITVSEYSKALAKSMDNVYSSGVLSKLTMRLFGLPYQFLPSVDTREPTISKTVGVQFMKNMMVEGAILTITPGKPKYLGTNSANRTAQQNMLLELASFKGMENVSTTTTLTSDEQLRYYDFEQDYLRYIQYVNVMCRSAAALLGISGKTISSKDTDPLSRYNWKNYRYASAEYIDVASSLGDIVAEGAKGALNAGKQMLADAWDSIKGGAEDAISAVWNTLTGVKGKSEESSGKVKVNSINTSVFDGANSSNYPNTPAKVGEYEVSLEDNSSGWDVIGDALSVNMNYVQFYVNPSTFSETISNSTTQSSIKSEFIDKAADQLREIKFLADGMTGAEASKISNVFGQAGTAFAEGLEKISGGNGMLGVLGRIANVGKHVITGDSMVFPEIFSGSEYEKSYSIQLSLKTPYGDRFSYYMNIIVPLCHLIALVAPKQTTANTYSSPFLVRAFMPGMWNCNLGIVSSLTLNKGGGDGAISVDGYPLEVDVQITIRDLYADLMIAPSTDPVLFLGNQGLVDFLSVNCGLDLTIPNYEKKAKLVFDTMSNGYFYDINENITDAFNNFWSGKIANLLKAFTVF